MASIFKEYWNFCIEMCTYDIDSVLNFKMQITLNWCDKVADRSYTS